jgi:threonine dehydrogenase-like Zn-dependent dehydrogenase
MPTTSRAAVLETFNQALNITQAEVPAPQPGALVAEVIYGGICGTDVHLHHGNLPIPTPLILGHEAVGRVWQLGEGVTADFTGEPLKEGDLIAWASNIPCGKCYWCVVERERTLCADRKVYGVNQCFDVWPQLSGGWADYIYLQPGSAVFRLPDGVTPEQAIALGCAGPTAVHGVNDITGIKVGDTVVVQGSGPVGMAAAMYAQLAGAAKVIVVGGPANRLALARELGIGDVHIDIFATTDPTERLRMVLDETPGKRGADVVLECAGVPSAVAEGFEMARRNAKYLVLGQYTDRGATPINPHVITRKQLKVYGSWAFAEAHYLGYVQSLPRLAARFDLERFLTPYPLAAANEALADVAEGKVMKAVLQGAGATKSRTASLTPTRSASSRSLALGTSSGGTA